MPPNGWVKVADTFNLFRYLALCEKRVVLATDLDTMSHLSLTLSGASERPALIDKRAQEALPFQQQLDHAATTNGRVIVPILLDWRVSNGNNFSRKPVPLGKRV